MLLNLAEICPSSHVLGPGKRFIIWVQGCSFNCPGCVSPDWIPQIPAHLVEPIKLAEYILSLPDIDGLTVSGGEPMLQAAALGELFSHLRQKKDLSIICYTGFTLAQLQAQGTESIQKILSLMDVLIDGQYIASLNDNRGWRGSSNQQVHFLTPRHLSEADLFTNRKRDVEIYLGSDSALMVGVPPKDFQQKFGTCVTNSSPKTSEKPCA